MSVKSTLIATAASVYGLLCIVFMLLAGKD